MTSYEIRDVPEVKELETMPSAQIEEIGAELFTAKVKYTQEYKAKQDLIQNALVSALERERKERISTDPDYWNKHQGIGANLPK